MRFPRSFFTCLIFVGAVAFMLCAVLTATAQDSTPEAVPVPESISLDVEELPPIEDVGTVIVEAPSDPPPNVPNEDEAVSLAEVLIAAVLASAFGTAPVTTFLVSLLKRVLPVDARLLTAVVALALAALTAAATYFGFGVQWNSLLDTVGTVGPTIVLFIGTLIGAPAYYNLARRTNAPVISYQRTVPPAQRLE